MSDIWQLYVNRLWIALGIAGLQGGSHWGVMGPGEVPGGLPGGLISTVIAGFWAPEGGEIPPFLPLQPPLQSGDIGGGGGFAEKNPSEPRAYGVRVGGSRWNRYPAGPETRTSARGENGKRAYGVRDAVFSQRTADRTPMVILLERGRERVEKRPPGGGRPV